MESYGAVIRDLIIIDRSIVVCKAMPGPPQVRYKMGKEENMMKRCRNNLIRDDGYCRSKVGESEMICEHGKRGLHMLITHEVTLRDLFSMRIKVSLRASLLHTPRHHYFD